MLGPQLLPPVSRDVTDAGKRVGRIAGLERRFLSMGIGFEVMVDENIWSARWDTHRDLVVEMKRREESASTVRAEGSSRVELLRARRLVAGHQSGQ